MQHLENVVEESIGLYILIVFVGASVASLVEPGHDINDCCLVAESADMLGDSDWAK